MWWHKHYVYRRQLFLQAPPEDVPVLHPVNVTIARDIIDQHKARRDFRDIELIYVDSNGNQTQIWRSISLDAEGLHVTFQLQDPLNKNERISTRYYLYYGNPTLINQRRRVSKREPGGDVLFNGEPTGTGRFGQVQELVITEGGLYTLEALGAQGGTAPGTGVGGYGARIRGDFHLETGTKLKMIVGQKGIDGTSGAGGGGASAIWIDGAEMPLIVAGGGGGHVNSSSAATTYQDRAHAHVAPNGKNGVSGSSALEAAPGGSNGLGGGTRSSQAQGGAGWLGDAVPTSTWDSTANLAVALKNGGTGGGGVNNGGFGGGGAVTAPGYSAPQAGGGGGFSGGGGGRATSYYQVAVGGGGGSYNAGDNQMNWSANHPGDGMVSITSGGENFEIPYDHDLITYTRPGEHWIAGRSSTYHARASMSIYATELRIYSDVNDTQGIAEIQIDGSEWEEINLYSKEARADAMVYEVFDLSFEQHEIRIRVSGKHDPKALTEEINIRKVEYLKPIYTKDLGEQFGDLMWAASTGGEA